LYCLSNSQNNTRICPRSYFKPCNDQQLCCWCYSWRCSWTSWQTTLSVPLVTLTVETFGKI